MHITRLEVWPVRLALSEPYTIAYETVDATINVFLRLHTNSSLVGYGCAAPDRAVTGETGEGVVAALENLAGSAVIGMDLTRPAAIYQVLTETLGFQPAALAAVDMAVWDLLGKVCNLPLWKLLGGHKPTMRTSMTIGILPEQETVEQACRWISQGFSFLKLKGGQDVADDIHRIRKVRAVVGPDVALGFDANQGYSLEQGLHFLKETRRNKLVFLEQPTPRRELGLLEAVQSQSPVPIMADESLTTAADALYLACGKKVELFNLKLMKVGGISAALPMDGLAQSAGIGVMIGCMDESALAIAAGLHLALGRPNICYADLDSHFALPEDPAAGAVRCRDGWLSPNEHPGLGFNLD